MSGSQASSKRWVVAAGSPAVLVTHCVQSYTSLLLPPPPPPLLRWIVCACRSLCHAFPMPMPRRGWSPGLPQSTGWAQGHRRRVGRACIGAPAPLPAHSTLGCPSDSARWIPLLLSSLALRAARQAVPLHGGGQQRAAMARRQPRLRPRQHSADHHHRRVRGAAAHALFAFLTPSLGRVGHTRAHSHTPVHACRADASPRPPSAPARPTALPSAAAAPRSSTQPASASAGG